MTFGRRVGTVVVTGVILAWGCTSSPRGAGRKDAMPVKPPSILMPETLHSAKEGSVRLAIADVVDVIEHRPGKPGDQTEVNVAVVRALAGTVAEKLELLAPSGAGRVAIASGQRLLIAVSPFRHRTSKLALVAFAPVDAGQEDRVADDVRAQLSALPDR